MILIAWNQKRSALVAIGIYAVGGDFASVIDGIRVHELQTTTRDQGV
jgi:hypothetical protein